MSVFSCIGTYIIYFNYSYHHILFYCHMEVNKLWCPLFWTSRLSSMCRMRSRPTMGVIEHTTSKTRPHIDSHSNKRVMLTNGVNIKEYNAMSNFFYLFVWTFQKLITMYCQIYLATWTFSKLQTIFFLNFIHFWTKQE